MNWNRLTGKQKIGVLVIICSALALGLNLNSLFDGTGFDISRFTPGLIILAIGIALVSGYTPKQSKK